MWVALTLNKSTTIETTTTTIAAAKTIAVVAGGTTTTITKTTLAKWSININYGGKNGWLRGVGEIMNLYMLKAQTKAPLDEILFSCKRRIKIRTIIECD